jgi:hypothetical protein
MVAAAPMTVAPVPRLWPESTIVCLGSGPSLTRADVESCRGRAKVIAIKDTVQFAPWADALYCGDEIWWQHYGETTRAFAGLRFGLVSPHEQRWVDLLADLDVHRLLLGSGSGVETDPRRLATGGHSGHQALNLAAHLGARTIVLLGYDMKPTVGGDVHFFGSRAYQSKKRPPYEWLANFASVLAPFERLGVRVINATRDTALTVFPRVTLEEALA